MSRFVVLIIFVFCSLVFTTQAVFAWDDDTTHPALTNNAIDFYNQNAEQKISDQEKEWLLTGSIQEDASPRWINHFYDPVYNQCWTGEHGPGGFSEDFMQKFSDIFLSTEGAVSAINWVHNQELQDKYKLYKGNQTWEKAIYEYVKNKDKKKAFTALGHVLHLLQDMAVPEHTRNDTHPGDSPLENYSSQFNKNNFYVVNELGDLGLDSFGSFDEYFNKLANYSNNNFFSKDTILDEKYDGPEIEREDGASAFGLIDFADEFLLAKVNFVKINDYEIEKFYDIQDKFSYHPILDDYWTRLSREAILSGAGVLNLFFQEVERAEEDQSILVEPPEDKSVVASFFDSIISPTGEAFRITRILGKAKNWISGIFTKKEKPEVEEGKQIQYAEVALPEEERPQNDENEEDELAELMNGVQLQSIDSEAKPPKVAEEIEEVEIGEFEDVVAKDLKDIGYPSEAEVVVEAQSASVAVAFSYPSSNPQPDPLLENVEEEEVATTPVSEPEPLAPSEVEEEPEPEPEVPQDTTPPDISFSVAECVDSLLPDKCFVATTTLNLSWSSEAEDLDVFELVINEEASTTKTTSSVVQVSDQTSSVLSVRAKDLSGNWSELETETVEVFAQPIILNEIAWAGTKANANDEWIELYNRSEENISLNNWVLYAEDSVPYINLSGDISAGDYYLIERSDNETVADIEADLTTAFSGLLDGSGLGNSGEILILSYASSTIDQSILAQNGNWPAGESGQNRKTMERYDLDNWYTNNGYLINGLDSKGDEIYGTPGSSNSVNTQLNLTKNIEEDLVIYELNSPCFVDNTSIIVEEGAVLTANPGVVFKFYNDASLHVEGKILVEGTAEKPIVFTSLYDTDYASGFVGDGSRGPIPGDWHGVYINDSADEDSVFDNVVFRYGGKYYNGQQQSRAILSVEEAGITISNSIFEYSKIYGFKVMNSDSQITNNIFRNNNNDSDPAGINAGLYISGGSPTIQNNSFSENRRGLYLSNSLAVVNSNSFNSNSDQAIYSSGSLSEFVNNSGSDNGTNAISLCGNLTSKNDKLFLEVNDIPYYLENCETPTVVEKSELTIESGVVVKGFYKPLEVEGDLIIDGENPEDIVFTSMYDDGVNTPSPGQFKGIKIAEGGSLEGKGFTIRYAGSTSYGGNCSAGISVEEGLLEIENALFQNNYPYGIYAVNSDDIKIENAKFENHAYHGPWGTKAAMAIYGSTAELTDIIFENNVLGILSDEITSFITNTISWIENVATTSPGGLF
ncbi:MAG: right-handed parallel beta-helix repeat-containing protein [Patescibacteria group bacterium]